MGAAVSGWDVFDNRTLIQMQPEGFKPRFEIRSDGTIGFSEISFTEELLNQEAPFRSNRVIKQYYKTMFIKSQVGFEYLF